MTPDRSARWRTAPTVCRQQGIRSLVAEVLPENSQMSQVLRDAGYTTHRHTEPGVMTYELNTEDSETASLATEGRKRLAEAHSLERVASHDATPEEATT